MALERRTFDRVCLAADGVSAQDGLCEADLEQTRLKELMAWRSGTTFVLTHAAKLSARPFRAWARLDLPWTLVTDSGADPRVLEEFKRAGVLVEVAASGD